MLTRQPRKGERIEWDSIEDGWPTPGSGIVHRVEDNLCWLDFGGGRIEPFIWRFKDGLNTHVRNAGECINVVDTSVNHAPEESTSQ